MAMKNISHSPVTEMLSGRHKIWLIIGLALLPIADFAACIVLWVFGATGFYWALPFLMTVVDLAYLLCVVLSNQRFKYAQKLFFVYITVTIVFLIVWLAKFADSSAVILSGTVEAVCGLLHVVGIVAVAISYLYASRRLRVGRHIQLALAIIFSAVALFALVIVYGVTVISDGYFGQGHGNLPLIYSYIGDDACEVTGVVYGKGDSVVIPYEFNGRKVTKVSANVFSYPYVKSVTLNCDSNVALCEDMSSARSVNTNILIYADKKDVDTIKAKLYREKDSGIHFTARHMLGNNVRPMGLDKDEVYVTFDYDRDSYLYADRNIIPTWYGKKGDTFKLSDIDGVDYAEHSDVSNDDDLFYCYGHVGFVNGGGYIMSELQQGGTAINGTTIDKSRNNVQVRFQKIYKVFAGKSNDDMYNTADHFIFTTADGVKRDYKLIVADKADELLEPFDRGEAFTRTMQYRAPNSSNYREFTSLSALLREGYSEVQIAPYWELVKPQITLSTVGDSTKVVYGDDFELSTAVSHPLGGVQIEYDWFNGTIGDNIDDEHEQNLRQRAMDVGMTTYGAVAKVSAPQVTSCVSSNTAYITVNVQKRPLTVKWRMEGGGDVYDGNPREILNTVENSANGEGVLILSYSVNGNAGTFTEQAEFVNSSQASKYTIAEGASYTYTIKPRPVPLTWDEQTEFEYDRSIHRPTAHALDLSGNELVINYTGYGINAGDSYTTTAKIQNTNYTIDDSSQATRDFKITPKPVITLWGSVQLTYNGNIQAPEATTIGGVDGENVAINVSGGQTDVNVVNGNKTKIYTAVATSANKNYTLTGTTSMEYTIEPYGVTVNWTNTTVTYNGQRQMPTATYVSVKNQTVPVGVTIAGFPTGAINAGPYTATATIASANYTITGGATHEFIINKMAVTVEWGSTTLTYNGQEQTPTATAKGLNGEDLPLTVSGGVKIGSGVAKAEFTAEQQNYTLINASKVFGIERKTLTVTVQDATFTYGQSVEIDIDVQGIVNGDDVTAIPTAKYTLDEDGNVPVGEYEIIVQLDGEDKDCYKVVVVRQGKLTVKAPEQTED